jgi:hypothetical protein
MATCRQIVTTALRKLRVVGEGNPAPVAYDAQSGLEILKGWYLSAVNGGLFGRMTEVVATSDYTAKEFERIRKDDVLTVTLPTTVTDTISGLTRAPIDLAAVVVTEDGEDAIHNLYDAALGSWVVLDDLTLDSVAPLSTRGPDELACHLAMLMADEFGGTVGQVTLSRAGRFIIQISYRNASPRRAVDHEFY